jgi:NitT/TauT family transport system permease protein
MPWIVTLGSLLLWQGAVRLLSIQEFILPAPTDIFDALLQYRRPIFASALFTLGNTLSGFGIGIAIGLILGMVIGTSRLAYAGL